VSPPTLVQGVVADSVVGVQFVIDRAASLTVGVTQTPTTALVPTSGMKMTLAHGTTVNRYAWTPTASTLTPLYPYTDGYQAWAGGCADADPEYTGNGGSRGAALTVTPGATTTGSVPLVGQTVLVHTGTSSSPTPVPNRAVQVQAVHAGTATCAGGLETINFNATTGSDGKFTIALPYSTWTI
jgi:hypothetical protein